MAEDEKEVEEVLAEAIEGDPASKQLDETFMADMVAESGVPGPINSLIDRVKKRLDDKASKQKARDAVRSVFRDVGRNLQAIAVEDDKIKYQADMEDRRRVLQLLSVQTTVCLVLLCECVNKVCKLSMFDLLKKEWNLKLQSKLKRDSSRTAKLESGEAWTEECVAVEEDAAAAVGSFEEVQAVEEEEQEVGEVMDETLKANGLDEDDELQKNTCDVCDKEEKTAECLLKCRPPSRKIKMQKAVGPVSTADYLVITVEYEEVERKVEVPEKPRESKRKSVAEKRAEKSEAERKKSQGKRDSQADKEADAKKEEPPKKVDKFVLERVPLVRCNTLLNCFTVDDEEDDIPFIKNVRKHLIKQFTTLDECSDENTRAIHTDSHPYLRQVETSRKGIPLMCIEQYRKDVEKQPRHPVNLYIQRILSGKPVHWEKTNTMSRRVYEYTENDEQGRLIETEPNLQLILQSVLKYSDKRMYIVTDFFVVLREVHMEVDYAQQSETKRTRFCEPIFVHVNKSSMGNDYSIDQCLDYRIRLFYYSTSPTNEPILVGIVVPLGDVMAYAQLCVDEKNLSWIKAHPKRAIIPLRDRRIVTKVNLDQNNEPRSVKEYVGLTKMKFQTVNLTVPNPATVSYARYRDADIPVKKQTVFKCSLLEVKDEGLRKYKKVKRQETDFVAVEHIWEPNVEVIYKQLDLVKLVHRKDKESMNKLNAEDDFACTEKRARLYLKNKVVYQKKVNEQWQDYGQPFYKDMLVECAEMKDKSATEAVSQLKPLTDQKKKKAAEASGLYRVDHTAGEKIRADLKIDVPHLAHLHHKCSKEKLKGKEIMKYVVMSSTQDIVSEIEIKCGLVKQSGLKMWLTNVSDIFTPEEQQIISAEIPKTQPDENGLQHLFLDYNIQTTNVKRTLTAILRTSRTKAIEVVVEEPNPYTIMARRMIDSNDHDPAKLNAFKKAVGFNRYFSSDEDVRHLFTTITHEKRSSNEKHMVPWKEGTRHDDTCPVKRYGKFNILSTRTFSNLEYKNGVFIREELKKYIEPKVVKCMCLDCSKTPVALQSTDACLDPLSFTVHEQIISAYDILIAVTMLINETKSARDQQGQFLALEHYKMRIQRFMTPVYNAELFTSK